MTQSFPTRRTLAKATLAAAVAPAFIPSTLLGKYAPSNRITVGFIGLGGHGYGRNLGTFLQQPDAQPLVLCDVDLNQLPRSINAVQNKFGKNYHVDTTQDWRNVITREDIDAVMISTPDHWHVPISIAAAKAGKDVISEKPTLTVAEGRTQAEVVKRYGTVFQTSTEDRSVAIYHRIAELVRNGRIGQLKTMRVTLPYQIKKGDPTPKPIPENFDYNMWLGPAPVAPYNPTRCHFDFRWIEDYSGGILTDWGMHMLDTAQWANDTEHTGPIEVIPHRVKYYNDGLYNTAYEFELEYTYKNGVKLIVSTGGTGIRCEGTEGWVESPSWRAPLQASDPKILTTKIGPRETHLFTNPAGEHRNFLDCVKTRKLPYFPAEIGHRCATIQHIGNIAMKLNQPLKWNPDTERFIDNPAADRQLSRAMREPWSL